MSEKKKPRALILEDNAEIRQHAESILSKQGWDVVCKQISKDALDLLAKSKKSPFALFISNYKLPKMEGDDILRKVRAVSPLTQRMLLIPADKLDLLISAIHKAKINACIISPFNDKDLISRAKKCFHQFKRAKKRERFKRVTLHQNKQMLKIAQTLKQKDYNYTKIIEKKKQKVLKLKSIKRELAKKPHTNISLSGIIDLKEITPSPDILKNEFINISKTIKNLFDKLTHRHNLDPVSLNLSKILNQEQEETPEDSSDLSESMENIIKSALTISKEVTASTPNESEKSENQRTSSEDQGTTTNDESSSSDDFFKLSFSENRVKAYIKSVKNFNNASLKPTITDLLELLKENQISYGIVEDITIESWIENSFKKEIIIAQGEEPVPGRDGKIKYHFETEFTNPGKINEDGSIDFKERGAIPFVSKGETLAVKTAAKEGKSGIDISGIPIQVDEVINPVFTAGAGTEISEDELTITAVLDGQPNLDAMGTITVNPELAISGDVDFETGNIDFKGNIVVNGMVKEGFSVKGVNLTAKELEGATIDLTGDLNISAGITDSKISTQGNIYAKFINHSDIMTFGNLEISKEIIDSKVISSGSCINQSGHIISSNITAKMGIEAGNIGTISAKPDKLKVGVDQHLQILTDHIQESLKKFLSQGDLLKEEIKKLEEEDQELYQQISEKAHIQDRAQLDIKELKDSNESDNSLAIKNLQTNAKKAEQELNKIFERQDDIEKKIGGIKDQIKLVEENNKTLILEKKALMNFAKKEKPLPVVTIAKTIAQDTMIKGPRSSLILKEDASRCKIQELAVDQDGISFYEMTISDP
jgi:uncharacterized protein